MDARGEFMVHPQVQRLMQSPQWVQRTPEWYERRKTLMTASNAAAALSIKPYDSFRGDPRADAIQQIVTGSFKGNVATRHGTHHEDSVRDRLCDILGETCLEFGLLVHPTLEWLAASPDGITLSGRMIEIKCPYRRRIVPGVPPHHYMPQMQVQMEVCNLDSCIFCQWQPAHLNPDGTGEIFDIVVVERDKKWFAKHQHLLRSFWEDLMDARAKYVPPPAPMCLVVDDLYADIPDSRMEFLDD